MPNNANRGVSVSQASIWVQFIYLCAYSSNLNRILSQAQVK
jgi:hypothetical protein